jgi:DNA-binding response OmpR family regulator
MSQHNILFIEDDANVSEAVCFFLDLYGFRFTAVADGLSALELLKQDDFDLVLCDISLPDILGYEILKFVRSHFAGRHLPFIFLTAYADKRDIGVGLDLGADEYITKPFSGKVLAGTINAVIAKYNGR